MPVVTDLPAKLVLRWYPRNAQTLVLVWPASIAGREFVFRRPGKDDIDGVVSDDTLSFAVPALTVDALKETWTLVETTTAETTLMGGAIHWGLNYDDTGDPTSFTVTIGDGSTSVIVGVSAEVTQEASARAAADTALDARLDTLEADPITATEVADDIAALSGTFVTVEQAQAIALILGGD